MLKTINTFSVALLLTTLLFGCENDCVIPKGIYGEWNWTMTEIHGSISTPEILGYTEKLSINDFTFKRYINDSLVYESQYDLTTRTDSLNIERNFIVFSSGFEEGIYIGETELVLAHIWILEQPSASYYSRN